MYLSRNSVLLTSMFTSQQSFSTSWSLLIPAFLCSLLPPVDQWKSVKPLAEYWLCPC